MSSPRTSIIYSLLEEHYAHHPEAWSYLKPHVEAVAEACMVLAVGLSVDSSLLWEMAMLHDIGVYQTYAPAIGCTGSYHYLWHGTLGRKILEKADLKPHALVAERHTGVGLTVEDIIALDIGLPEHPMVPVSLEEQLICFVDNFFSKSKPGVRTLSEVCADLSRFGDDKVEKITMWWDEFNGERAFRV